MQYSAINLILNYKHLRCLNAKQTMAMVHCSSIMRKTCNNLLKNVTEGISLNREGVLKQNGD